MSGTPGTARATPVEDRILGQQSQQPQQQQQQPSGSSNDVKLSAPIPAGPQPIVGYVSGPYSPTPYLANSSSSSSSSSASSAESKRSTVATTASVHVPKVSSMLRICCEREFGVVCR